MNLDTKIFKKMTIILKFNSKHLRKFIHHEQDGFILGSGIYR
jgi:hypothetical protein